MNTEQALQALLRESRFMERLAGGLLRDAQLAEDVLQEVRIAAWQRPPTEVRNVRAWIAGAIRHRVARLWRTEERRLRREALVAREPGEEEPRTDLESVELLQRVADAVGALRSPYRETILARYFRGLSAREIATASGVPIATVRTRELRALEQLRARLDRGPGGRSAWALALLRVAAGPSVGASLTAWWSAVGVGAWLLLAVIAWRARAEGRAELASARSSQPASPAVAPAVAAAPDSATPEPEGQGRDEVRTVSAAGEVTAELWSGRTVDLHGRQLGHVQLEFTDPGGGEVLLRTTSDGEGRFRIPRQEALGAVRAELAGHLLVRAARRGSARADEEALRVVLSPAGELALEVLDAQGQGIAGLSFESLLAPAEVAEPEVGWATWTAAAHDEAVTDASGRTGPLRVPSGVALMTHLFSGPAVYNCDLRRGAQLVLDERAVDGQAIVVEPGERLELVARFPPPLRLSGELRLADGRRARDSTLHVVDLGSDDGPAASVLFSDKTDDGRFDVHLRIADLRGPLQLTGWQEAEKQAFGEGGESLTVTSAEWTAERLLSLEDARRGSPLVLELTQRPVGALEGRVIDATGRRLARSEFQLHARAAPGWTPWSVVLADGRFRLFNLPLEQDCELIVATTPGRASGRFHTFSGLRAGATDVELRLPESSPVLVDLEVADPGARIEGVLMLAELDGEARAERAPGSLFVGRESRWPRGIKTSAHDLRDERRWHTVWPVDPGTRRVRLALGEPGVYSVGVVLSGPAGTAFQPLALGPRRFEAGEHTLTFEALRMLDVAGRVLRAENEEPLALLLDPPLEQDAVLEREDLVAVQGNGAFLLRGVALGRHRIRLGTPAELLSGRWQREATFTLPLAGSGQLEL